MRAVLQRVAEASVRVEGLVVGSIGKGILVYLGVAGGDGSSDAVWMAEKIANIRIFPDAAGAMNRSILDAGGSLLLVSQFTLLADARKGRRPSFSEAAPPDQARLLYEAVRTGLTERWGLVVEQGVFQADMRVTSVNEGPVTILLDTKKTF
jgi:D-tyrosyl-tRNA(Tyr) deacylase